MRNRRFLLIAICALLLTLGVTHLVFSLINKQQTTPKGTTLTVQKLKSTITADGSIHSQNEAVLHFQTGGKLAYLPVQIGDTVYQGQTIAELDTYPLQQQLSIALNNYQANRDQFDQLQQNQQNNTLQMQQQNSYGQSGATASTTQSQIYDIVKRIVDENQSALNNSVSSVNLANYAIQLASITAPFNGVITAEDVTSAGLNVSTATSFSIADPNQLVFRANIAPQDIALIHVGDSAQISLSGQSPLIGAVQKIYPSQSIQNGQSVYQVDIVATNWGGNVKLGQVGSVSIQSSENANAVFVPSWIVVGHDSIWIKKGNDVTLEKVTTGNTYDNQSEVLNGLKPGDKLIADPRAIAAQKYTIL